MRIIAVFCLFTLPALAQHPLNQRISYDQAVRDTRTFINLLADTHPDPYTANGGRIEFFRKAQAILSGLPREGIVVGDLATRLRELIIPISGHTSLNDDRWWDPAPWLPIQFGVADDAVFVASSDLKELADLIGYRLVGCNGHPVEQLVKEMQIHMTRYENRFGAADGVSHLVRSQKFVLNLFPSDDPDHITFQLMSPAGKTVQRDVSWTEQRIVAPDKSRGSQPHWSELPASDNPFFTKIFDRPAVAYLRVAHIMGREAYEIAWRSNTGNVRDMLKNYYQRRKETVPDDISVAIQGVPSFLESSLRLLEEMKRRQIPTLIIDLRGNGGGWTPSVYPFLYALYGDAYYAKDFPGEYITRESALFLQKHNATVEEWRRKSENPLFEPGDYSFETAGESDPPNTRRTKAVAKYKQEGYSFADALEKLDGQPLYQPKHVVVLTDSGTFSAAFHFLYYLHHLGAKSVGVPPSQSPNAYMEVTDFTLPESKLRGSIANSLQLFMPEDPKADTFPVTHPLTYDVFRRYAFDHETALRYALDLIATGKL